MCPHHSLSDVIGHRSINSQLIADQFAANGYFVMMPDLFHGDAIPLNKVEELDIRKWFGGGYNERGIGHGPESVDPIVESCVTEMRTTYKCKVCPDCLCRDV
jgi:hypothetical protein